MDNVTHSLAGIVFADLMMRPGASKSERRVATGAAVIAANLPDIDIAYAAITPAPLGYLLHHRGHTHTIVGAIVLTLVLLAVYWRSAAVSKWRVVDRARLWALIVVALASHLLLDSLNSYGIHPFYPFDSRWFYGDTVFIFEPWLWMVLGLAVAWNARTKLPRAAAVVPVLIFPLIMASSGIIPPEAVAALALGGVAMAALVKRSPPRRRAAVALAACLIVMGVFATGARAARRAVLAAIEPQRTGEVLDVILTPNPASPLCWSAIIVELRESQGEYVVSRGTLSLAPRWKAPTSCASYRFAGPSPARLVGGGGLAMTDEFHQPLARLRHLERGDCWARAWLRFGRAPVIRDGEIFDLRFAQPGGRRFTYMPIEGRPAGGCPQNIPAWGMPRADLIFR